MRIRGFAIACVTIAALALTGCSNSQESSTATTSAATSSMSTMAGTKIDVMESEYSIELSQQDFKPGRYTFVVMNHGQRPHDLAIKGPGVDEVKSSTVNNGETTELTVDLEKGDYELWCTVGDHKDLGMDVKITVA
ncbi:plastocyanin/azurin family copper-binding protein [Smaragdicoccus niigatensis]|uniref:plastocyanin/azurin family copper-binding protein n=1 Tax=Smaragdicoccus niigatensis TaxID=359359 RepID=UPI00138AE57A|nr:plastocyanin/azurin family copper-binding protein [Smaragdicoccus niigatensis]